MAKKKITIVHNEIDNNYKKFFEKYFIPTFLDYKTIVEKGVKEQIDLVLFTGGADVNPSLYGEMKGKNTYINEKRDEVDSNMFYNLAHVPKIGICRGAQLLTVLSGGKLIQHVEGHSTTHSIAFLKKYIPYIYSGSSSKFIDRDITSTHHQMMYPFNLKRNKFEMIAWSKFNNSSTYLNGDDKEIDLVDDFVEPEIVFYKQSNSLCIQGHPEYSSCPQKTQDTIYHLIKNKLL